MSQFDHSWALVFVIQLAPFVCACAKNIKRRANKKAEGTAVRYRSKFGSPMSRMSRKRRLSRIRTMSALPPIADIVQHNRDVRFVPKADIVIRYRGDALADFKPNRAQSLGTLSKSTSNSYFCGKEADFVLSGQTCAIPANNFQIQRAI